MGQEVNKFLTVWIIAYVDRRDPSLYNCIGDFLFSMKSTVCIQKMRKYKKEHVQGQTSVSFKQQPVLCDDHKFSS